MGGAFTRYTAHIIIIMSRQIESGMQSLESPARGLGNGNTARERLATPPPPTPIIIIIIIIIISKPVIIIRGNEKGTYMSIDVAISGQRNAIKKEGEILKCKDLTIEIQRM